MEFNTISTLVAVLATTTNAAALPPRDTSAATSTSAPAAPPMEPEPTVPTWVGILLPLVFVTLVVGLLAACIVPGWLKRRRERRDNPRDYSLRSESLRMERLTNTQRNAPPARPRLYPGGYGGLPVVPAVPSPTNTQRNAPQARPPVYPGGWGEFGGVPPVPSS